MKPIIENANCSIYKNVLVDMGNDYVQVREEIIYDGRNNKLTN